MNNKSRLSPSDYDIKPGQVAGNYLYDPIGNMTEDIAEGLEIEWNVYGKVKKITILFDMFCKACRTTDKRSSLNSVYVCNRV